MFNEPRKPKSLLVYEALNGRYKFEEGERMNFRRLQNGYIGEMKFHNLISPNFTNNSQLLFDISFIINGHETQIDTLIITNSHIYHLEIKNYSGQYVYENNKLLLNNGIQIINPLTQLNRTHELMKILLQHLKINLPLKSYLVFVNDDFHLYQAPKNLSIIFPNMIKSFIQKINYENTTIDISINNKIKQMHIKSNHNHIPDYQFQHLKKGIFCHQCGTKLHIKSKRSCYCSTCQNTLTKSIALKYAINDFICLFPNEKLTKKIIKIWINDSFHHTTIQRMLKQEFELVKNNRGSFYK